MKPLYYLFFSFFILSGSVQATEIIRGKVIDTQKEPIDAVAVILQTTDSVFVEAVITDLEGDFSFQVKSGNYRLFFQHLLYQNYSIDVTDGDVGTIELIEKENLLGEVTVTGERPQVKVDGGRLIYDTPQLIKNKPVTNAFDAIKELPGIITGSEDDNIQLLGAGNLNIVINGQLTTLTLTQLIALLKSIPASRVQHTEIMYSAPAKYNVKGALINVVIEQDIAEGERLQGEVGSEYQQSHYARGIARASILYSTPKVNIDFMANGRKGRAYGGEDMFARHTLKDEIVEIDQLNRGKSNYQNASFRLGADYKFNNNDKLSVSYYVDASDSKAKRISRSNFNYISEGEIVPNSSSTNVDGNSTLQNANIQYIGHQGVKVGVDFTNYRSPDHQHYINSIENVEVVDMLNDSKQDINKWMAFANHTYTFADSWNINYGINGGYTQSKTKVEYQYLTDGTYLPDEDSRLNDTQKEYGGNIFGEISHSFGAFSATVSLKAEYFRSDYLSNGTKTVLWDDWALFPTASLSYTFSPYHILQLNISSDKTYPSYWSVNPQTSYLNAYSVVQGNPALKPSREYEGQLLFILRQKYVFMAFCQYQPDKFIQLPYQQPDELLNVFRFENLNYSLTSGLGVIVPVSFINNRIQSRLTLRGMRLQEKNDHFHDISFDRSTYFGMAMLNNTINISDARPNLKLTLSGYYVSKAQQGIYELGDQYDVSAGLKWLFANDKAELTLKYDNIFHSRMPNPIVADLDTQYSRMKNRDTSWYFGIGFTWKFGGFKEKSYEKVDRSRLGK